MPPCRPALAASLICAKNRSTGSPSSGTLPKHLDDFFLQPRIHAVHPQAIEIVGHAADARADRHLVVVQNHQQSLARAADVVERFVDDAGRKRTVADHRDAPAILIGAHQFVATREAKRGRNARPRVARHEQVVFALFGIRVAHQAALGAHRVETAESGP